jgi:hypothetical protein
MRAGGGKSKGAGFERVVCKLLSLWISKGKRKDCFWRSAMSGGRATLGKKRGEDLAHQAGDICAVHPMGHALTDSYFIECKRIRDAQWDRFLFGGGILARFWKIAVKQAVDHDRWPMLIVQQNRGEALVILLREHLLYFKIDFTELKVFPDLDVVIIPLKSLLTIDFRQALKRKRVLV